MENNKLYSLFDVAEMVGKRYQTVYNILKYSDQLEEEGKARIMDKPIIVNNKRYYEFDQLETIKEQILSVKNGDLRDFAYSANNTYRKLKKRVAELEKELEELKQKK